MPIVRLATSFCLSGNKQADRRRSNGFVEHYEFTAPYDPEGLTERAMRMLEAVGGPDRFTTFSDGDDLTCSFHGRRRTSGIYEAAELIMLRREESRPYYIQAAEAWQAIVHSVRQLAPEQFSRLPFVAGLYSALFYGATRKRVSPPVG